jgi:CTP:molybdopterin cytidylyltransferase MocA
MVKKQKVSAIILAAGFSTRMGTDKALLIWQNKPLIHYVFEKIAQFTDDIVIVCGDNFYKISEALESVEHDCLIAYNLNAEDGMFSSLQIGVSETEDNPFFIQPVDVPFVKKETYEALLNDYAKGYDCIKPSVKMEGKYHSGHPILLSAKMRTVIYDQPVESKLNDVLKKYAEKTKYVEVDDQAILQNFNTPDEWRKITEK